MTEKLKLELQLPIYELRGTVNIIDEAYKKADYKYNPDIDSLANYKILIKSAIISKDTKEINKEIPFEDLSKFIQAYEIEINDSMIYGTIDKKGNLVVNTSDENILFLNIEISFEAISEERSLEKEVELLKKQVQDIVSTLGLSYNREKNAYVGKAGVRIEDRLANLERKNKIKVIEPSDKVRYIPASELNKDIYK